MEILAFGFCLFLSYCVGHLCRHYIDHPVLDVATRVLGTLTALFTFVGLCSYLYENGVLCG